MLDSSKIKNEAMKQTNLENFGNPLFLEGFESLIQSINHEADLNDIGLESQKYRLTGVLANLLMIEEACIKHPEILKEEIQEDEEEKISQEGKDVFYAGTRNRDT